MGTRAAKGPSKDDLKTSSAWAIAGLKSVGVGIGPVGGEIGIYDLVSRATFRAHRFVIYSGQAGFGLPVSGNFTNDDYTYFMTPRPVAFPDFDGVRTELTSRSAGIYSSSTLKIFGKNGEVLADLKMSGFGLSTPEIAGGGVGGGVVHYTMDGRPVETPDWVHEVKPEDQPQILDKDLAVRPDHSIVLPIPGDVLFEFGKADLTFPTGVDVLGKAGLLIDERAGDYRRISIEGHTDSVGSTAFNKQLSKRRAETVQAWLMNYLPARKKSLKWEIVAHGEEKPVATNRKAEGRAKNRRVEIILWER